MTSNKLLLLGLILLLPRAAGADDNHYQDYIVGNRAVGLGGAFTAISDDSSGAYYNPAGLAEAARSSISLAASIYGFSSNGWTADAINFSSDNTNFITYPTTAAWIQRVRQGDADGAGRVQLALSLITPRSNANRKRLNTMEVNIPQGGLTQPANADFLSVLNLVAEDDTLWVGLSGAWKIFSRLSLGLTAFVSYRTAVYQEQGLVVARLFRPINHKEFSRFGLAEMTNAEMTHLALLGVLGVMVTVTDNLKIGASFRSPGLELYGKADFQYFATGYDLATKTFAVEEELAEGVTFRHREPLKATLGFSYLAPRRWGAALDFSIFGPVGEYAVFEDDAYPKLAQAVRNKKKLIWQLDLGGEYYVAGKVPLRAGFFTNLSSFEPVAVCGPAGNCDEGNFFNDPVDMYGVTGSVGYELDQVALNLGVSYSFGGASSRRTYQTPLGRTVTFDLEQRRSYLFVLIGGAFRF